MAEWRVQHGRRGCGNGRRVDDGEWPPRLGGTALVVTAAIGATSPRREHLRPTRFAARARAKGATRAGFTLFDLLLVMALIAVLAALALPAAGDATAQRLRSAASMLASDLNYLRALAISTSGDHTLSFFVPENLYLGLEGPGPAGSYPGVLSDSATLDDPSNPSQRYGGKFVVAFDDLPALQGVRLWDVVVSDGNPLQVTFDELGSPTPLEGATVWLMAGTDAAARFVPVIVEPPTGHVRVGPLQTSTP